MKTITFEIPEVRLSQIDLIAELRHCNRSVVICEALSQYLSLFEYHRDLIEEGIRQDDANIVIEHEELMAILAGKSKQKD